jgi:hypothetical protein
LQAKQPPAHHFTSRNIEEIDMANSSDKQGNQGGRGFAGMDDDKQREIASEGGRAAHESGNAHEFTSEEAREAGSKGGQSRQGTSNQSSQNRSSGSSRSDDEGGEGSRDRKDDRGGSNQGGSKSGQQSSKSGQQSGTNR